MAIISTVYKTASVITLCGFMLSCATLHDGEPSSQNLPDDVINRSMGAIEVSMNKLVRSCSALSGGYKILSKTESQLEVLYYKKTSRGDFYRYKVIFTYKSPSTTRFKIVENLAPLKKTSTMFNEETLILDWARKEHEMCIFKLT